MKYGKAEVALSSVPSRSAAIDRWLRVETSHFVIGGNFFSPAVVIGAGFGNDIYTKITPLCLYIYLYHFLYINICVSVTLLSLSKPISGSNWFCVRVFTEEEGRGKAHLNVMRGKCKWLFCPWGGRHTVGLFFGGNCEMTILALRGLLMPLGPVTGKGVFGCD